MNIKKPRAKRGSSPKNSNQTVEVCEAILQTQPDSIQTKVELVRSLMFLGDDNRAIEECERGLQSNPKSAILYYLLGSIYCKQSRYKISESILKKSIELDPTFVASYSALGVMFIEVGRMEEAITYLQYALRMDAKCAVTYSNLAIAYARLGKYLAAYQAMTQSLRLAPSLHKILSSGLYWLKAHPRWARGIKYGIMVVSGLVFINYPMLFTPMVPLLLVGAMVDLKRGKIARGLLKLTLGGILLVGFWEIYLSI